MMKGGGLDLEISPGSRMCNQTRACRQMWAACFALAVSDYKDHGSLHIKMWITSNASHVGSFVWLCHLFDFDVDVTRSRILKYKEYKCKTNPSDSQTPSTSDQDSPKPSPNRPSKSKGAKRDPSKSKTPTDLGQ